MNVCNTAVIVDRHRHSSNTLKNAFTEVFLTPKLLKISFFFSFFFSLRKEIYKCNLIKNITSGYGF